MITWGEILLLLIGIPVAVIGLSDFPILTFLALAFFAWFILHRRPKSSWRSLFWLAAVFGLIGESICVFGPWCAGGAGLWSYAFPSPPGLALKLPVWLPLVWGNLFVLFAAISEKINFTSEKARFLLVLAIVSYAGVLFRMIDIRILFIFTPFFAAFLLYWNQPEDLAMFCVAAILGSIGEIMAMREGLWIYTQPLFKNAFLISHGIPGVPISLGMAWGLSGVFLRRISHTTSTRCECSPRSSRIR